MELTEPQTAPSAEQGGPIPNVEEVEQAILSLQSDMEFHIGYDGVNAIDERGYEILKAIEILTASRSKWAVMPLLELFVKNPLMANRVKGALLDIGEPAILPLKEVLLTGDKRMRPIAVELLGRIPEPRSHTLLIQAFKDPDANVRYEAVFAVNGFSPEKGLPLLIDTLQDENPKVRAAAVISLARERYRAERTTTALMEMAKDPDPEVRCNAIEALNVHGDTRAFPLLLDAMHDREARIRETAIKASSIRPEPRFIPQYLHALKDREQPIRNRAGQALLAFGDREALVLALFKCDDLSASDKLNALELLGRSRANIVLYHNGTSLNQVFNYRFSSVAEYFQLLQKEGSPPEFEQVWQEVQRAIKARQDRQQLLRGSEPDLSNASEELLRAHSGVGAASEEELLRASDSPSTKQTDRTSWFARLFGRK